MRDRAAALAYGGEAWTPPPARDAATVCLLRDAVDGLEVFLMRRTTSMSFAAGMHVYPGGALEESDARVPLAGRADLDAVAARMSTDDPAGLLAAAARETFEECGVLLALDADGRTPTAELVTDADRADVADGRRSFADLLDALGLVVDDAALVPFAHWVTPEVEDRRYDTRFLAAALPEGQVAARLGGEADRVAWWRPGDALAEAYAGRMAMLPPTMATLEELARHADAAAALDAVRALAVAPLLPHPFPGEGGEVVWHLVHDRTREVLVPGSQPHASETDGTGTGSGS
ncbi:MAG: NUDIX hydrolase [Candidatus Nanopelagicales bacterium]